jgi:hypothetical protein
MDLSEINLDLTPEELLKKALDMYIGSQSVLDQQKEKTGDYSPAFEGSIGILSLGLFCLLIAVYKQNEEIKNELHLLIEAKER